MLDALDYLIGLVDDGFEFPDAVYRTSSEFDLDNIRVMILEKMYDELLAGSPAVTWSTSRRQANEAATIRAIRAHDCKASGCGPVCTAFEW